MRNTSGRKSAFFRGSLALALTLVLFAPGLAAKERKGATIRVVKPGQTSPDAKMTVEGELLAVRGNDLIIMEKTSRNEVVESLLEVKSVEIKKMSSRITWAVVGALAGAAIGYAVGPRGEVDPDTESVVVDPASAAALLGLVGGTAGYFIVEESQKNSVNKKNPESLAKIAARLKKYARDKS